MIQPARPPGTNDRAICSTCRKPAVVTSPTRAPLPSRMALVAMVVPCSTSPISPAPTPAAAHTCSMPRSTPTDWSSGVDAVLARQVSPDVVVDQQYVGERPADIDPEPVTHVDLLGAAGWLDDTGVRQSVISASDRPSRPRYTASLCSPSSGPARRTDPGVADSFGKTFCIGSSPNSGARSERSPRVRRSAGRRSCPAPGRSARTGRRSH